MGGKRRSGCFFNWIRSDIPDTDDSSPSVVLLAVRKAPSPEHRLASADHPAPETADRHQRLLSELNDRFRKTLSLDSRRSANEQSSPRPKSMVQTPSYVSPNLVRSNRSKDGKEKSPKTKKFRPKSFFSLETFLDSRRSEASSADDFSSSKYCKFYLDSAESSPVFKGRNTPDLLDTPGISNGESRCKKRLDKLENHFNKIQRLRGARTQPIDNERRDYNNIEVNNGFEDAIYSEPFYTSQTTLVLGDKQTEGSYDYVDYCVNECIGTVEDNIDSLTSAVILSNTRDLDVDSSTPDAEYVIDIKENDILINDRTKQLVVKVMDKSVDSIGSCSLDVDAENTDFSDTTSGSLNILTPSSAGSHFRDFTSRLQERVGPVFNKQDLRPLVEEPADQRKKPSYLHLACSVNGYSNITTYDSKLRQKLNKSREASPGRPGNTADMLRDCKDDAMATRLNSTNTNSANFFKNSFSESSISSQNAHTFSKTNGTHQSATETHASRSFHLIANGAIETSPSKSFIQQRVERLYGPGALAQGFFNQKRQKTKSQCEDEKIALNGGKVINHLKSPEGVHQISRTHVLKRSLNGAVTESIVTESCGNSESSNAALPVLRHLRPEFRAQLPILSPKRSVPFRSNESDFNISPDLDTSLNYPSYSRLTGFDIVDRGLNRTGERLISPLASEQIKAAPQVTIIPIEREISLPKIVPTVNGTLKLNANFADLDIKCDDVKIDSLAINGVKTESAVKVNLDDNCNRVCNKGDDAEIAKVLEEQTLGGQNASADSEHAEMDAHYFLELKKLETERLIRLAETAERDLEELHKRGDANEEVLGFLRAAGGKARLLATQKMQQFEGLCHNNLNRRADEPFPTTCSDLRGFWDMVSLQLTHIAQLFQQLDVMRAQGWTEVPVEIQSTDLPKAVTKSISKPRKVAVVKPADPARAAIAAKKREEQRKALLQARRSKAATVKADDQGETSVEIYAPVPRADADKPATS